MAIGLGHKGGIIGFGVETDFGDPVARTEFIALLSETLDKNQDRMKRAGINKISVDKADIALGRIICGGDFSYENRYDGSSIIFQHAMGGLTTAEVATFATATASNDSINFKEGGGGTLTATVAQATLIMGESSATADSHCKAVKTALDAAGALTYTVTFSNTTKLMTITASASTFQYIESGSTGGALIGFTADSAAAIAVVADTAVVTVFDHTFTIADALPTGLSIEVDTDTDAKIFEGCKINNLKLSAEADGFMNTVCSIIAEDMNDTTVTGSTLSTAPLVRFTDIAISYTSSIVCRSFNLNLNNNLDTERYFLNSAVIKEPLRSSSRIEVTGSFTVDYEIMSTYLPDFETPSDRALVATATSTTAIKTGFYYTQTLTAGQIIIDNAIPKLSGPGIIPIEIPFTAYADDTTREFTIVLRNGSSTI